MKQDANIESKSECLKKNEILTISPIFSKATNLKKSLERIIHVGRAKLQSVYKDMALNLHQVRGTAKINYSTDERRLDVNESNGFKFAIALIASLGTIFYNLYYYLQSTAITEEIYCVVCIIFSITAISVLFLLVYLFFKGYSLEVQSPNFYSRFASLFYYMAFLSFMLMFIFYILLFFILFVPKIHNIFSNMSFDSVIFILIIPICLIGTLFIWVQVQQIMNNKKIKITFHRFILLFVMIILAFVITIQIFSPVCKTVENSDFMNGDIVIDMNNVYSKNNALIPVYIEVTGLNSKMSINFLEEDLNHNLVLIDKIQLDPHHNSEKLVSGKSLIGNALDFGKYNIFIDSSNLSEGYYELICEFPDYNKQSIKYFYLYDINYSESVISPVNSTLPL